MKCLVLAGPNLNFLGIREPEIYGSMTYEQLVAEIKDKGTAMGIDLEFYQSNHEGDLVDAIQGAYGKMDGIIINPAAYTHTSVALLDALKAVNLPTVEVHLSDVAQREDFRQISYVGKYCQWTYAGLGKEGYFRALETLGEHWKTK